MSILLGVIADDFTGATDVASMLVRAGLRTVLVIGVPEGAVPEADALVVALKSRTVPAAEAVAESLAALRWLQGAGARQFYFKYCSTFDSTPAGNIGPVAEALMAALNTRFTIACPAFPENGRTVYRGHLFVGDGLLSDSGMRQHPLTPMTDSNLVRVLQAQSQGRVGLVRHDVVAAGAAAIRERFAALQADGVSLAVVDALGNADLFHIAAACIDLPLITAGSGVAFGLPAAYAAQGWTTAQTPADTPADRLDAMQGAAAVLAGSCSVASNAQVAHWRQAGRPAWQIDVQALALGQPVVSQALAWAAQHAEPVLIHATADAAAVAAVQAQLGVARAGSLVEHALAQIAQGLVTRAERAVQTLVVAGGETSGAVVQALGVQQLRVGPTIDPGVPWTQAAGRPLWLALKSGNFGGVDFFTKALAGAGT